MALGRAGRAFAELLSIACHCATLETEVANEIKLQFLTGILPLTENISISYLMFYQMFIVDLSISAINKSLYYRYFWLLYAHVLISKMSNVLPGNYLDLFAFLRLKRLFVFIDIKSRIQF